MCFPEFYCKLMKDAFFSELISLRIRVSESSFDVLGRDGRGWGETEKEKSLLRSRSRSDSDMMKIFKICTYSLPRGESISDDQEDKVWDSSGRQESEKLWNVMNFKWKILTKRSLEMNAILGNILQTFYSTFILFFYSLLLTWYYREHSRSEIF